MKKYDAKENMMNNYDEPSRTFHVWTAGKNGCEAIAHMIVTLCIGVMFLTILLLGFKWAILRTNTFTFPMAVALGLIGALCGWIVIEMFEEILKIKKNCLIFLYLYDMRDFAGFENIPEDLFVLFEDKKGVVLSSKETRSESKQFASRYKSYDDYLDLYQDYLETL